MIGIGVTTRNRNSILENTLKKIKEFSLYNKLVVVDDASDIPVEGADFRFETNVGIAVAKNKCLELLEDCDHIFLFDDDTYPTKHFWWLDYVNSKENHLMYIFPEDTTNIKWQIKPIYHTEDAIGYTHTRGCVLYYTKKCLEKVGGFNPIFGKYGFEHVELSHRIYRAGLTSARYMDIKNSKGLFYSGDEQQKVESSFSKEFRIKMSKENLKIISDGDRLSKFVPYKSEQKAIVTCYFTGMGDPQRNNVVWDAKYSEIQELIDSLKGQTLYILHNCFDNVTDTEFVKHIKVETTLTSPYWQRWFSIKEFIYNNPQIKKLWCVDATDVEVLKDPFKDLGDFLYVGYENSTIENPWMRKKHPASIMQNFFTKYSKEVLVNAGIIGGRAELVQEFISELLYLWQDWRNYFLSGDEKWIGETDMGAFNYIAYTKFLPVLSHGSHVTTEFKAFEKDNTTAWFRHK